MIKLKTASGSGLISKNAIANIKNSVAYISREPSLDSVGNIQSTDGKNAPISDPIKDDFDVYDFTNAHVKYWKRAIYIALPNEGLVLIYDLMRGLWQPPQTMPISRLAIIGDWLYGHSAITNESYKLFDGTNDNGNFISQIARFAYNNGGRRDRVKNMSEYWSDGYITTNGLLVMNMNFGFNGSVGKKSLNINGEDTSITNIAPASSLGSETMGSLDGLPDPINHALDGMNKFWQEDTMNLIDYVESYVEYTMDTLNGRFAIVAHGSNQWDAQTSPNSHKK